MTVYEKLSKVQVELKAPKSQYNAFGKYKYRNCEDILEAVKPIAAEHKAVVMVGDTLEMLGNRIYIKATALFIDVETGEVIEQTAYAREEESKKGMDASQVTGATSSYARKYALNGLFCIDDTKDADSKDNNMSGGKEPEQPEFVPATAEQLHKMNEFIDAYAEMCETATPKDILDKLKAKFHFKSSSDVSTEIADRIIKQVETWYKLAKEK